MFFKKLFHVTAVLILIVLPNVSIATDLIIKSSSNAQRDWETQFCTDLYEYSNGAYQKSFESLESAVKNSKPGPEVQKCVALMRLAFLRVNNQELPVEKFSNTARDYIRKIEDANSNTDVDLVLCAVFKGINKIDANNVTSVCSTLDKLIESSSEWKDWAYWEKTQILSANTTWVGIWGHDDELTNVEKLGIVRLPSSDNKLNYGCLVGMYQEDTFRARAAQLFLAKHPNTYMAKQMELEIYRGLLGEAFRAIGRLDEYLTRHSPVVISAKQALLIKQFKENIIEINNSFSDETKDLLKAGIELNKFFTDSGDINDTVMYLKTILNKKDEKALPEDVRGWMVSKGSFVQ